SWDPFFKDDTVKKLTCTLNSDGRLEIFRTDKDNHVSHTTQDAPNAGSFGSWQQLYLSTDKRISIAAGANLDGRLEVFAVGEDNHVFRTGQTSPGNWSKKWVPADQSNQTFRDVWMARNADGTLEVIGIAVKGNTIQHTKQISPGGAWTQKWDPL